MKSRKLSQNNAIPQTKVRPSFIWLIFVMVLSFTLSGCDTMNDTPTEIQPTASVSTNIITPANTATPQATNVALPPTLIETKAIGAQIMLYLAPAPTNPSNTANNPAIIGFNVYRVDSKHPDDKAVKIGSIDADKIIYIDSNVTVGLVYTYTLKAFNTNGESAPSNSQSAHLQDLTNP